MRVLRRFVPAPRLSAAILGLSTALSAAAATPAGFPFADEDLNYSVNWPSGLSLGEAHLHARNGQSGWTFEFTVDAGVPGYQVKDDYRSQATADNLCSISFERDTNHGGQHAAEADAIQGTTAKRGNGALLTVPPCVKDALAFLFLARRELGQGRVPPRQQILFGKLYTIEMRYDGAETIQVREKSEQADRLTCTVTGASSYSFDIWFARDAARTPLEVRAGFAIGAFSMELVR